MIVAFDLDGTLLLGEERGFPEGNGALDRRLGVPGVMEQAYAYTTTRKGSFLTSKKEQIATALALANPDPEPTSERLEELLALYLATALPYRKPDPAALPLLAELRAAGVTVGVQTAAPADVALPELEAADLSNHLDFVLTTDQVGAGKGTPRFSDALSRQTGEPPLVVVGDSEADLLAGRLAGAFTILVQRSGRPPVSPQVPPDWRVADLGELRRVGFERIVAELRNSR